MEVNRIEKTRLSLIRSGRKIINLSSGLPEKILFPQKILEEGFKKYLKKTIYQPEAKGSLKARSAIVKFYKKRKFILHPDQILLTSGTSESYFEIFKILAKTGEEILFPNPGYPLFEEIARLAEIKINYYQLDEKNHWQINCKNLRSKINSKTRAIVIVSPHNPTGSVLAQQNLEELLKIAEDYQLPIMSDEVFSELIFDKKKYPRIAALSNRKVNIFTLNGVSKIYSLPGLKLSWVVVSGPDQQEFVEKLERETDVFLSCNQISQILLPMIIQKGESFIRTYRNYLQKNRDVVIQTLTQMKNIDFHFPEAGPYIFIKIDHLSLTDEEFVIKIMEKTGIFVHPGYFYDYDNGLYIALSYVSPPLKLKQNLKKIIKFIKSHSF